jgi:hypothetical protein
MRRSVFLSALLCMLIAYPLESQSLLNRVKKAVSKEITGATGDDNGSNSSNPGPEPQCARDDARLIADLSKFKLDYNEMTICEKEDGSILIKDRLSGKYYLVKDGKSEGPLNENDPRVTECVDLTGGLSDTEDDEDWTDKYPSYITKSGDKYMLKFNGSNFGSYAIISDFAVSTSKNKFAALVTENVMITQDQGKKMEAEMEKAKTDQERLEISMKYSQQMTDIMMQPGGTESLQAKLVSNIPGATYDAMKWMGGRLNSKVKFDDIVVIAVDRIIDLKGNTLTSLSQDSYNSKDLFLNSSGTKYASYKYGTLTFSDKTSLSELFNPSLTKVDGKVYLTYMYFSPAKNALMQAAIPF